MLQSMGSRELDTNASTHLSVSTFPKYPDKLSRTTWQLNKKTDCLKYFS